tara:strand:+ start:348 stop:533 length:186 start_codon:yes stop_codon:yes gene_type:complete
MTIMDDIVFNIDDKGNMAVITSERIKEDIQLGLRCPLCEEFTKYDEWAKPKVACIDCGVDE